MDANESGMVVKIFILGLGMEAASLGHDPNSHMWNFHINMGVFFCRALLNAAVNIPETHLLWAKRPSEVASHMKCRAILRMYIQDNSGVLVNV